MESLNSHRHLSDSEPTIGQADVLKQAQACTLQLQAQIEREHLLAETALRIRRSLNPTDVLQSSVVEVRRLLEAERVIIYRFEPDWSGVVVVESVSEHLLSLLGKTILDHCFAKDWAEKYQNGRVQATGDIHKDGLSQCHIDLLSSLNIRANLVVPIVQESKETLELEDLENNNSAVTPPRKRLWGLLSVQQCSAPRHWQTAEIDIVEKLATHVAIAIQQAELYTAAQAELMKRQQAEAEVRQLNTQLEQRVRQRTAQLEATNQNLKREIALRLSLEAMLRQEKELAQITLESIGDAVITTDAQGQIQYLNPVAEQLMGWTLEEVKAQPLSEVFKIVNEMTRKPVVNPVGTVLREGQIVGLADHTVLIARDGTERAIDDSAAPIRNRQGQLIGAVLVFHDVTQARQLAQELSWQAEHDALTGLVNRRGFEQQLTDVIFSARQGKQHHALCYLDLDQFKVVNDTCGHVAGDELLRQVTALLQHRVRAMDTLARLGGDEFGLLFHRCSLEKASQLAETLRMMIQAFQFSWRDKTFKIGVSIGVVGIDANSQDLTSVLSDADAACYAAKAKGRNCVHTYHINDQDLVQQRGERQWISRLHQALEEGRFRLYIQTIYPLSKRAQGAHGEILLRLVDEAGLHISPMVFIPAAERYNLMSDIDRWVVQAFFDAYQTYRHQQLIPDSSMNDCLYNINLSGASVNNPDSLEFFKQQLLQHHIPPQTICFEITETAAISNLDQATQFMHALKQLGCRFALDDFGSGMSSLNYLKNLPVDYLKIDGSFVTQLLNNRIDSAIVECFNRLSHELGIQTIAEYVEDRETLQKLKKMGVDYAQGYSIAKPVPLGWAALDFGTRQSL